MALLVIEGFDDGLAIQKGWSTTNLSTVTGRFGGLAFNHRVSYTTTYYLSAAQTGTVVCGMALKPDAITSLLYGPTIGNARLRIVPGGALALYRADNDSQVAISSDPVWPANGIWRYVELKYTPSTGECVVRADGVVVITGSVPTVASVSSLIFVQQPSSVYVAVDDLYVLNNSGAMNNDFLGDVRVQTLYPNADGTNSGFTPSTGTTHYTLVDEVGTPNTTDLVSAASAGLKETYQFQDLGVTTAGIYGVQATNYAAKDNSGAVGLKNITRIGGAQYTGLSAWYLSATWTANRELWEVNPATSGLWAPADVNNAEFGIESL